jgi:hypothetical protein
LSIKHRRIYGEDAGKVFLLNVLLVQPGDLSKGSAYEKGHSETDVSAETGAICVISTDIDERSHQTRSPFSSTITAFLRQHESNADGVAFVMYGELAVE